MASSVQELHSPIVVPPVRILITQPPGFARDGTRRILEDEPGFRVVGEASTLPEALPLVRELQPDVLVLATAAVSPEPPLEESAIEMLRGVGVVALHFDGFSPVLPYLSLASLLPPSASGQELIAAVHDLTESPSSRADPNRLRKRESAVVAEYPTRRELEVLRLVEQGMSNSEMANRLHRTTRAMQFHVSNLLSKLGAHSRTELIHLARKRGWLD
jgi:DNA-binding NarL/FixJ family response regulator